MSSSPPSSIRRPTASLPSLAQKLRRWTAVLIALLALPALAGPAKAGEPPEVFHSPTLDGQPPAATPFSFSTGGGPSTLDLWIETGPAPTVSGPQVMCVNALGDELCGWLLEIETTGGITITGFPPEASLAEGHPIRFHAVSDTRILIIRVNAALPAAGDLGTLRIGSLALFVADDGEVRIGSESEAIDASGRRVVVEGSPIAVPEPAVGLGLGAGLALLAGRTRRRRRTLSGVAVLGLALALALVGAALDASAQRYLDTSGDGQPFRNAVENVPVSIEDFESFPVDGNGHAAISNGYDFGEFTYTHNVLASDVPLDSTGIRSERARGTPV